MLHRNPHQWITAPGGQAAARVCMRCGALDNPNGRATICDDERIMPDPPRDVEYDPHGNAP